MGKSKEEFDSAIESLKSSKTEEDIFKQLTFIVKGFDISLYKDILMSNPYYKDLLIDVREDVLFDLNKLKEEIKEEISSIEEIIKTDGDSSKLKDLKGDCISLSYEIDRKISQIKSLA